MNFSKYLDDCREKCRELVNILGADFDYVGVLGEDSQNLRVFSDKRTSGITEGQGYCGFVVKLSNGGAVYEYSFDDFSLSPKEIAAKAVSSLKTTEKMKSNTISAKFPEFEKMTKSFKRDSDFDDYSEEELLSFCSSLKDEILSSEKNALNAQAIIVTRRDSKLFVSKDRELDQVYGWANSYIILTVSDEEGKIVSARENVNSVNLKDVFEELPKLKGKLIKKANCLLTAKPIEPGVYDVITDSSITGLIAHEAFGHGVEMDQFVKDRALAKKFVGDYVASPIASMHDGASATLSAASYFFDDDGILAHDTTIIKDGILVSGLCDLTSACQLGVEPTGNGRRQSFKRKAYARMTNTFFSDGTDRLEDMIKSVKHGYMLFETNNGMEDPKNWQIQCTAEYGIEIINGKLTDNYVAPVVMSGYVPDLLKSITMISDGGKVIGSGMCGKGYKEWVRVSDGGPCLKVRVKLA
ncbi:MAG: TldD/PmbA family protein [bacterium]|nr:TldD/PmbA family protein [bacterium]